MVKARPRKRPLDNHAIRAVWPRDSAMVEGRFAMSPEGLEDLLELVQRYGHPDTVEVYIERGVPVSRYRSNLIPVATREHGLEWLPPAQALDRARSCTLPT